MVRGPSRIVVFSRISGTGSIGPPHFYVSAQGRRIRIVVFSRISGTRVILSNVFCVQVVHGPIRWVPDSLTKAQIAPDRPQRGQDSTRHAQIGTRLGPDSPREAPIAPGRLQRGPDSTRQAQIGTRLAPVSPREDQIAPKYENPNPPHPRRHAKNRGILSTMRHLYVKIRADS